MENITNVEEKRFLEISLYDMNKQLVSQIEPLTDEQLVKKLEEIIKFWGNNVEKYYMLLSNEKKDYTVIHFVDKSLENRKLAAADLATCLTNRGPVRSIGKVDGGFEIWIDTTVYYLFPYDNAVLEYK